MLYHGSLDAAESPLQDSSLNSLDNCNFKILNKLSYPINKTNCLGITPDIALVYAICMVVMGNPWYVECCIEIFRNHRCMLH